MSIEIVSVCAGGGHITCVITEDGAKPRQVSVSRDDLTTLLSESEKDALLFNTLRYYVEKGVAPEDASLKDIVTDSPSEKVTK